MEGYKSPPLPVFQEDYALTYDNHVDIVNSLTEWADNLVRDHAHAFAIQSQNILAEYGETDEINTISFITPEDFKANPRMVPNPFIYKLFGFKLDANGKLNLNSIDPLTSRHYFDSSKTDTTMPVASQ